MRATKFRVPPRAQMHARLNNFSRLREQNPRITSADEYRRRDIYTQKHGRRMRGRAGFMKSVQTRATRIKAIRARASQLESSADVRLSFDPLN